MISKEVSSESYKKAMACFPSGVTIVTTSNDANSEKFGFTASAFLSLSLSPPLVLVCLATNADCYESFIQCNQFAVNIIGKKYEKLAFKFATKGVDKFGGNEFVNGKSGLPILTDCAVSLECKKNYCFPGGDHVILVGEVKYITMNDNDDDPTIWHKGEFHKLD